MVRFGFSLLKRDKASPIFVVGSVGSRGSVWGRAQLGIPEAERGVGTGRADAGNGPDLVFLQLTGSWEAAG